jgi:hypothetical protein
LIHREHATLRTIAAASVQALQARRLRSVSFILKSAGDRTPFAASLEARGKAAHNCGKHNRRQENGKWQATARRILALLDWL